MIPIPTPKFEVGQSVYLKEHVDNYVDNHNNKYDTYGNPKPASLVIVGIRLDGCPAGWQILYQFVLLTVFVNEIALVSELPNLNEVK